jgi:hypothetical protein
MKRIVTNKLSLPIGFVKAVENDPYDSSSEGQQSDYTITGLLKPPRSVQLAKEAILTEDAADLLFALQGQVIHSILERSKGELEREGFIIEKRYFHLFNGSLVSAQIDMFDPKTGHLSDYKYTSYGSAKKGLKKDHEAQVNFQAFLIRQQGMTVNKADITILMRDWSAERVYSDYPLHPCMIIPVPLWTDDQVITFIESRVKLHKEAKRVLPLCTAEERWNTPTFAVMNPGAKRATRVFDTELEATNFIKTLEDSKAIVQARPGISRNCLRYCPVRSICTQWKEEQEIRDEDGLTLITKEK